MAEANDCLAPRKRIRTFAAQRIYEIDKDVRKLNAEKKMWEEVIQLLNPCQKCAGFGEINVIYAQDYSQMEPCKTCNGTGQRKE